MAPEAKPSYGGDVNLRRSTSGQSSCRGLVALGAALFALSVTVIAEDLPQPISGRALPKTVTLKTDMVFHVPFSVSRDTVPVMAGTEVRLIDVRGDYLKLGHGLGVHVVDPANTDFAERVQKMPQVPAPPALNLAARSVQLPTSSSQPARPLGNRDERPRLGLGQNIQISVLLAAFILFVGLFLRARSWIKARPQNQALQLDLIATGQLSMREIASALDDLDWFQLERLVAALFRAKGNHVETRGGANADGGIDLVVDSASSKAAVQCKHWTKWKCGPNVVRELIGAMKHESINKGFLVCRTATSAAYDLAVQERITIVDRNGLVDRIDSAIDSDNEEVRRLLFAPKKLCPKCGSSMVRRTATKGSKVGSEFWGCSNYPGCRQTMRA